MTYPTRVTWQFRNVTKAQYFTPTLESIDLADTNQQDVATFTCEVVDAASAIEFDAEDEVWVKAAGVKVFGGRLKVCTPMYRSEVGPRSYHLEAQDFTARLDDSVIDHPKSRGSEAVADRLTWILTFLNFAITTTGVSLPAFTCDKGDFDGMTVREALDALADEARLSYYVDYEKDLHVFRTETVTAPFLLDNDAPDYLASFPFREWSGEATDSVELGNATLVIGEKRRAWVESAGSIATWGRQERSLQDSELVTTAQVQNAGLRANAENDQPVIEGSFTCHEPGLQAGMTIHFTAADWPDLNDVVRIVTEVTMTAVDPHDDLGVAMLRTEVTYSDRRRARPYRAPRHPKPDAEDEDGADVEYARFCLSALRNRISAGISGSDPTPMPDAVTYDGPVPPAHKEVTNASPAHRRSYLACNCPPTFQGGWTGWKIEEQWLEVVCGTLVGVTALRITFAPDDDTCMDGKELVYGYRPEADGPPTYEQDFIELGRMDINVGFFDVPASVLTPSATNYICIAPGWDSLYGVECCDDALLNGLEGPLGGVSIGGCEFNSGTVSIEMVAWPSTGAIVERVTGSGGGLTQWTGMTGDVDGANRVFTLPDWNGKGVPQVRIGAVVYGAGTDYDYDDEAGTVTMRFAPWTGALLLARWMT